MAKRFFNQRLYYHRLGSYAGGVAAVSVIVAVFSEVFDRGLDDGTVSRAREFLRRILIPSSISGDVVEKYFRKALRVGAWRALRPESRALILVLRRFSKPIRSPTLKSILYNLFLEIELFTVRGKALFFGFILAIKNRLLHILKDVSSLLVLGISYLNNPPMYRVYG